LVDGAAELEWRAASMSDRSELEIKYRNLSLSAKGVWGIVAAIVIAISFLLILAFYGFKLTHG
jgi:hypothetical protein